MAHSNRLLAITVLLVASASLGACGGPAARTAKYLDKGQAYMAEGNFEKARLEFRNALQISPNNIEVRLQNGIVEEKLGGIQRAAAFYQGVIDLDKTNVDGVSHLARMMLLAGSPTRAMDLLQPAMTAHPDSAKLLPIRAAANARLGDMPGALADAERAVKLAPNDESAVVVLGGLYSAAGRNSDAQALLEGALTQLPDSADLRQVLVQFYTTHDAADKAESVLKDLVRLKPAQKSYRLDLARFYSGANRLDDAERTLRDAMRALPGDSSLRLALIEFFNVRRGRDVAERELQAQITAHPDDYDLQTALAGLYVQDKQPALAEAIYRQIIAKQDKNAPGLLARDHIAALKLQVNDAAAASTLIAEVLEANPRDTDALVMRSEIAMVKGDAKSAIVDLRTLLRDKPDSTLLMRQLARAYLTSGEQQLGEDMLNQAMKADANDSPARADLAALYLQSNRAAEARPLAEELVKRDPKNYEYRQLLFRAAAATKDYAAADKAAESIREDHPDLPLGWYLGGLLAEARSRPDEALRNYDKALEMNAQAQEPLSSAVKLLVAQKKPDAALLRVATVLKKYPTNAYAQNLQGEVLVGQQRWADAEASFQSATQQAPQWWVPYRNLAYVRIGQKDMDGALALLTSSAEKLGQPEPLAVELANLQQRLGHKDEAIAAYEALLRKNPQSEAGANNLAMLLVLNRNEPASLDRARDLVTRFAGSKNPNFLDTSGFVLCRHGDFNAALPVLEKAIGLAPDAALIRYHLALAQYGAGQKQAAVDNLQRAVQDTAGFDGADDARAKLAEWKKAS